MTESTAISLSEMKFSNLLESNLENFHSLIDERGLIFFPDRSVATKVELIEKLKSKETVFRNLEIHKSIARSYENTAVVQGEGYFNIKLQGSELNEVLNFIDIWVHKEMGWKLVSSHLVKMG
jgi:hypothetical protein